MNTLTKEYLDRFYQYDEMTGIIIWKQRPESDFVSTSRYLAWNKRYSGKSVGTRIKQERSGKSYLRVFFEKKNYMIHRLAWLLHYGSFPVKQIDHINGDGCDNRIDNLRDVTHLENCRNVRLMSHNTSGCSGVCFDKSKGKWRAAMYIDNGKVHLGTFTEKSDAIKARKSAEKEMGYHPNHGMERAL